MSIMTLYSTFLVLSFLAFSFGAFFPEVRTPLGKIRGKREWLGRRRRLPVDVYLGVPFAKPPIGELRFKKPVPIGNYPYTVNATDMPPACIQEIYKPDPSIIFPWEDTKSSQSEDCLYLNIWVPASKSTKKKAVMYWTYSGAFSSGSISMDVHNALALAAIGNVIVVTVNYRLSALGFMYSGTEDAPGNAGIHDSLEGLRWVNQNIDAFGGNKNLISIFGESAGSITSGMFAFSPLAKGLFKRVILESGPPISLPIGGNSVAKNISQTIAEQLDCANETYTLEDNPKEVLQCVRGIDAHKLQHVSVHPPSLGADFFLPITGDEIVPKSPLEAVKDMEIPLYDVLTCVTRNEGSAILAIFKHASFKTLAEKKTYATKQQAAEFLRASFPYVSDIDKVIDYYLKELDENDLEGVRKQTCAMIGDIIVLCPSIFLAEKLALKGKSYFAVFEHFSSNPIYEKWMGPTHFMEVDFVFGQPILHPDQFKVEERSLSYSMIKMWTNFAKTGSPSRSWPLFSKEHSYYRHLNVSRHHLYGKNHDLGHCEIFRSSYGL